MNKLTPEIIGWAQAAELKYGVPAALNIAAAIEESGLGEATPPGSNDWHGFKNPAGIQAPTKEQTASGVWYTIKAGFRAFEKPADSFMFYAWLIANGEPYAASWKAWLASPKTDSDVEVLTRSIAPRYATALKYAKDLVSLEEGRELFGYDRPAATPPKAAQGAPVARVVVSPPPILSPASTPAPLSPEARLAAINAKMAQVPPAKVEESWFARLEEWLRQF